MLNLNLRRNDLFSFLPFVVSVGRSRPLAGAVVVGLFAFPFRFLDCCVLHLVSQSVTLWWSLYCF